MDKIETLVIGCHHKTGTKLLAEILDVIAKQLPVGGKFAAARSENRKLPFSVVLQGLTQPCCYVDFWFEHEMDVPASSVRFLHFVRHPADRIRSGYLYHSMGGPGEIVPWLDWRVFRIFDKAVSYHELLNAVDDKIGILIEAIRSFPEIAGTARTVQSSAHLTHKLQISLEQIEASYDANIQAVCEFLGLDEANAKMAVDKLKNQDLSRKAKNDLPNHVTRYKPQAENLKRCLVEDSSFYRLYSQCVKQSGFECLASPLRTKSCVDDDLVMSILDSKARLLTDIRTEQGQADLRGNDRTSRPWLPYALQTFGEGGHLMMYEFIQTFIDRVTSLAQPLARERK